MAFLPEKCKRLINFRDSCRLFFCQSIDYSFQLETQQFVNFMVKHTHTHTHTTHIRTHTHTCIYEHKQTMSPDLLLSSVSHFNTTSINDTGRTGHEKGGTVCRECLMFASVLSESLGCLQWRKRGCTAFFFLAVIPFTGQPHPSSSEKCFIAISQVSIIGPC